MLLTLITLDEMHLLWCLFTIIKQNCIMALINTETYFFPHMATLFVVGDW